MYEVFEFLGKVCKFFNRVFKLIGPVCKLLGKVLKLLSKLFGVFALAYSVLFAVFYFDLDGKLLYYVVEPFLCKHYDKMERKDPLSQKYDTSKPHYEYQK